MVFELWPTDSVFMQPFEPGAYATVIKWYLVTVAVQLCAAMVFQKLGVIDGQDPDVLAGASLREKLSVIGVAVPLVEEAIFRVVPVALLSLSPAGIAWATALWIVAHGKRMIVIALVFPLYVKLALAGMLLEAFVIHMVNNSIMVTVDHYWPDD